MSWRTLETLGWLALYLGFAVFVLTADAMTPLYRAVFVERTTADWLPDADLTYVPGTTISGVVPSPYFGAGWWPAVAEGRWGRGGRSVLRLRPGADLPAGSHLRAQLGAFLASSSPVTIGIAVNGTTIATLPFEPPGRARAIDLPLPMSLPAGEPVEIVLTDSAPSSPLAAHFGADSAVRGVRLLELSIDPPP
ncbi:MAG: hypothetical protein ACTHOR_10465 [Devosia sp.]